MILKTPHFGAFFYFSTMQNITFLQQIATQLLENADANLLDTTVVLPNKRAKIFLLDALSRLSGKTMFPPKIISIENLIGDISGLATIEPIPLLFKFYEVYLKLNATTMQDFDQFANWAKTLLQDFNEIDRYLLEPKEILTYLKEIDDIKKWGVNPKDATQLLKNYVDFWKMLPAYYETLRAELLNSKVGYQGLIYRIASEKVEDYLTENSSQQFVFAGFNALNEAEEKIFKMMLASGRAKVFWDIDAVFLNDEMHDAGLFARKIKSGFSHYKSHEYNWISNEFSEPKNISIIGTPKSVGQAKIVGGILDDLLKNGNGNFESTALILGEENLLPPLLNELPASVKSANITMGYSAKNNPVQIFVHKYLQMHSNANKRNSGSFYYKDVLAVLKHPLIETAIDAEEPTAIINEQNITFVSPDKILAFHPKPNKLYKEVFAPWNDNVAEIVERLLDILMIIKENLTSENENERVTKTYLYAIFKVVNKLFSYFISNPKTATTSTLLPIYRQIIDLAEISFEGEPLTGLQIMGVLESRVLDFDTVIITSMNEGKFPAGKAQNSFIPYDVKREKGLPTFKEKDAIYTYHFYHLLQRAKNIYLLYNTESEGLDAGEKSRFITQLEIEKRPNHTISHKIIAPRIPTNPSTEIVVQKSPAVIERLEAIAANYLSPSALNSYVRNPLQFYYEKVLRIRDIDAVEENVAVNTLGTIIHQVLYELYFSFVGKILSSKEIEKLLPKVDVEVFKQFKVIYKEGEITKGKNLLAFEVAKRYVHNFLKLELESLETDEIEIVHLEKKFVRKLEHPLLEFPVNIGGTVDRIERRNGVLRIVDYKSGRVEKGSLVLKSWDNFAFEPKNDKIIQVLAYGYVFAQEFENEYFEAGIISFKNMRAGFMPFVFKGSECDFGLVTKEILSDYINELAKLIAEIFDAEIPFQQS